MSIYYSLGSNVKPVKSNTLDVSPFLSVIFCVFEVSCTTKIPSSSKVPLPLVLASDNSQFMVFPLVASSHLIAKKLPFAFLLNFGKLATYFDFPVTLVSLISAS